MNGQVDDASLRMAIMLLVLSGTARLCQAASVVCFGCYGGSCYWRSDYTMDFGSGIAYCAAGGAHIFSPNSGSEANFVQQKQNALNYPSDKYYLDARYNVSAGEWRLSDGGALPWVTWSIGQGTNGVAEPCAKAGQMSQYKWHDFPCDDTQKVVCEAPKLSGDQAEENESPREMYCDIQNGHALESHLVLELQASTISECLLLCWRQTACLSVNYRQRNRLCEISDATAKSHPHQLVLDPDSSYLPMNKMSRNACGY